MGVAGAPSQPVRSGADVLVEKHLDLLAGKRVGVVCNQTAVLANGVHLVDTLLHRGVRITALFAPEHGIRGKQSAGAKVESGIDSRTGLPIYSLYGGSRKPTSDMLDSVDLILFDMQDAGARFYTYASTMAYVMEAAAENGKKFILLDRPNPINGVDIEGPVLDLRLISFVGLLPIPIRHGMTLGELARMCVGEGYLNPSTVDLTVIPMEGWKRSMWYDQTGLRWIAPSPNMMTPATATVYPGMCLFEATNMSEGRGTQHPFEYIGAPRLRTDILIDRLAKFNLPGVRFTPVQFTPKADSTTDPNPKYKNKRCNGIYVHVTDRKKFMPVMTGLITLEVLHQIYPRKLVIKQGLLDRLSGDSLVSEHLMKGDIGIDFLRLFRSEMEQFKGIRAKYLLYR